MFTDKFNLMKWLALKYCKWHNQEIVLISQIFCHDNDKKLCEWPFKIDKHKCQKPANLWPAALL